MGEDWEELARKTWELYDEQEEISNAAIEGLDRVLAAAAEQSPQHAEGIRWLRRYGGSAPREDDMVAAVGVQVLARVTANMARRAVDEEAAMQLVMAALMLVHIAGLRVAHSQRP